jgi:predicted nucleotidyltransferase component of viral defense system
MLQKKAVAQEMIDLIKELQGDSLFKNHFLAGGTALALQLGHRTSTDIDLFTQGNQNAVALTNYFSKNYKNTIIEVAQNNFTRVYVNGIKIEMVEYDEKIIEEPINEDDIRFVGLNEIAAMKLSAITKRTEPRDFIDIAYLLKDIPLNKMFELYKTKFDSISPLYMKRTLLTKSKNINSNEWLTGGIKMLRHDIEPKDVPLFIENEIEIYNKTINIGVIRNSAQRRN